MPIKILRAIPPSEGIKADYTKSLQHLIDEMLDSVAWWLRSSVNANPPEIAQDAEIPSEVVSVRLNGLFDKWRDKFDAWAPILARKYVDAQRKATDLSFKVALKDAGWAVRFEMTPAMQDAMISKITENVGLIRSIPEQYFSKIEGIVMRSYSVGRDWATMADEIEKIGHSSRERAIFIAHDQMNKCSAVVHRARQLEIGIKEAKWLHSHGGRVPRPDHVAAHGRIFDVEKGCLISGVYIFPGELISCRCQSRSILPPPSERLNFGA